MPMENHRLVYTNSYHKVSTSTVANRAGRASVVDILKQCAEQPKKVGSELQGIEQLCDEAISRADTKKSRADDLQTQLNATTEAKGKAHQEITSLKAQLNSERIMKEMAEMIVTERDGQLRLADQNLERLKKEYEEEKEKLRQSIETLKKQVEEKQQEINDELSKTIEMAKQFPAQLVARKAANRQGRPEQQSKRTKRARVTFMGQSPDARVADIEQVIVAGQGNTAMLKAQQVPAIPTQIEMQETQTTNVPAPDADLPTGDLPEDVEEGQRREGEEEDQQIINGYPDA